MAWHLGPALENAGMVVQEVYSRNKTHADQLIARLYQAQFHDSLDFTESDSDLFIVSVTDTAIGEVASGIDLPENASIVHTSASQPAGVLAHSMTEKFGVLYPLQTFSKGKKVDFRQIPIFIESKDKSTLKLLRTVAAALSKQVHEIDGETRVAIHMAAVFACNFTNHMLKIAGDICEAHGTGLGILYPLIAETVEKAMQIGPEKAQTGPARRHDFPTLDRHLKLLNDNEELSEIYRLISQHISDTYTEE
ncbi:MAG: DUF2520 domain-containing protein [Cyclobacteriaceae bacterium]